MSIHQDSLLEIALRSRVIEKLSVALHDCLFAGQEGCDKREKSPQTLIAQKEILFLEASLM